jgi:hypothetical protein
VFPADPTDTIANGSERAAQRRHIAFHIHVGTIELTYHESPVRAGRILEDAGFRPPDDFILEALKGPHGPPVHEYRADQDIPLGEDRPKHFRAIPRGGGRA